MNWLFVFIISRQCNYNFLILFVVLGFIPLPLAQDQDKDGNHHHSRIHAISALSLDSVPRGFKLIFHKAREHGAVDTLRAVDKKKIDNEVNVEKLANIAEELHGSQLEARKSASMKAKQILADMSQRWADFAQKLTLWKSNEVMELTKKAQAAQILSLRFGSIATRLKSSVMVAQDVYNSAFDRYRILANLAAAAENHSSATSNALSQLQYAQRIREKWATNEQARALRLSNHLQNILYDLKKATEFAREAHDYAVSTQNYIHYNY